MECSFVNTLFNVTQVSSSFTVLVLSSIYVCYPVLLLYNTGKLHNSLSVATCSHRNNIISGRLVIFCLCKFVISVLLMEPSHNVAMTLEMAAHYYKAPKLLADCKLYRSEINM